MTVVVFLITGYQVYKHVSEIQNTGVDIEEAIEDDIEVTLLFHTNHGNVIVRDYVKLEVLP